MSEGILLVDKPKGLTSFSLVRTLRKRLNVQKIGHAGTLDPLATGLMVMLVGKKYTRLSDLFLNDNKEYEAEITLGYATASFDAEGAVTDRSDLIPELSDVEKALETFQGKTLQTPPMYSAKKVDGKKLCDLARKGEVVERKPVEVDMCITLLNYEYPKLKVHVRCSKGTYIRSLAHDMGVKLKSFGTLTDLRRTQSGEFSIADSVDGSKLMEEDLSSAFIKHP
ncbi:MAG: tRNA pseudouridine(55) synthase TruB [Chlamydiia bacterium]|nr:tRNA pseudouridine(55) synthase TruB [Chlamydiia bacterium]